MITDKTATPEPDSDPKLPLGEDIAAAFTALRRGLHGCTPTRYRNFRVGGNFQERRDYLGHRP